MGATQSQADSERCVKLITCMSKKLNPAERNYPTHEREFLALLHALRHWRHYVLGPHMVAFKDNVALRHYKTAPNLSPRMVRWLGDIEQYDLTLKHIPGAPNTEADALSRLFPMICSVDEDTWLAEYKSDPDFRPCLRPLETCWTWPVSIVGACGRRN